MGRSLALVIAWLALIASCAVLGAILSAAAAAYGLTSIIGDYRGEWFAVVSPIGIAIALLIGTSAIMYLRKRASTRALITSVAAITVISFAFFTWRFMAFAA